MTFEHLKVTIFSDSLQSYQSYLFSSPQRLPYFLDSLHLKGYHLFLGTSHALSSYVKVTST